MMFTLHTTALGFSFVCMVYAWGKRKDIRVTSDKAFGVL